MSAFYGTRPDHLPPRAVRFALLPDEGRGWVPLDGVTLLTYDEHRDLEQAALGPLPRRSDATVDWDRCPDRVVRSRSALPEAVAEEVRHLVPPATSVVMMPGSLEIPSIRVAAPIAPELAFEMASRATELWVLTEPPGVVLEYAHFHDTLVTARVRPSDAAEGAAGR